MLKRLLLSGFLIILSWMLVDLALHRLLLAPLYEESAVFFRPFEQMNTVLIYGTTLLLAAIFVGTYAVLVRPKSLAAGLKLGAFIGLALGVASGLGTYIHMPIPLPLALGWLFGGCSKGLAAGAWLGALVHERRESRL